MTPSPSQLRRYRQCLLHQLQNIEINAFQLRFSSDPELQHLRKVALKQIDQDVNLKHLRAELVRHGHVTSNNTKMALAVFKTHGGTDNHPIRLRFITQRDWSGYRLRCMDVSVPWLGANIKIRECSHCQETTSQMVNLWIQEPYCWLHSDQLVDACTGKSNITNFWFKLWHALDQWKTDANRKTNRIFAASPNIHCLPLSLSPPAEKDIL